MPGLLPWDAAAGGSSAIGSGPITGDERRYAGADLHRQRRQHAYRLYFPVTGGVVVDDLGPVGAADSGTGISSSFVTIAAGPTAAVICVAPNAYTCAHDPGAPLNQITDPDFPGATSVCYVDGYFIFSSLGNTS